MAPIVKMYTLGHDFMQPAIHAGGLRYHGMAPQLSALYDAGLIEAVAVGQVDVFKAALLFSQTEGILPRRSRLMQFGQPLMKQIKQKN